MQQKKILRIASVLCGLVIGLSCLAQAQAKPKEVKMDRAMQRKMNTLFSNFSEVGLFPFKGGQISNASLIDFGMWHRWINDYKLFTHDAKYGDHIKAENIESATQWYFGRGIRRVSTPDYLYKNGSFYGAFIQGEALINFAQVTKLMSIGKGEFAAYTREYVTFTGNPQGNVVSWRQDHKWVRFTGTMRGIIKEVGTGVRRHYILLEYKVLSTMHQDVSKGGPQIN